VRVFGVNAYGQASAHWINLLVFTKMAQIGWIWLCTGVPCKNMYLARASTPIEELFQMNSLYNTFQLEYSFSTGLSESCRDSCPVECHPLLCTVAIPRPASSIS
jgi:hypothetical protein